MVRRWSCLNFYSNYSYKFFFKKINLKLFKTSVNFRKIKKKKTTKKYTKFRRKLFIKLKHKTNFTIYTQILKYWIKDFMFTKNIVKFQYLNKSLKSNFSGYNFNLIKRNLFKNFTSGPNFITAALSRKNYNYFFFKKNFFKEIFFASFFINNNYFLSSSPVKNRDFENALIVFDDQLFTTFEPNQDFGEVPYFFLEIVKEFYKITTILFFNKIFIKK